MTESLEQAFTLAMQAVEQGNWPQASQILRDITRTWPECKEAWYQRAELSQRQGRLAEAVDLYTRVLELDPHVQEVYLNLGLMAARQHQSEMALSYWRQALVINPDYHEARLHLGLLLARLSQAQAAMTELTEVLKRAPETAALLLIQAREQLQRGMYPEASLLCQALRQSQTERTDQVLLIELQALHELGLDSEARELLAELNQPWAGPLRELYVSAHYFDQQTFRQAQAQLDQVLSQSPETFELPQELLTALPRLRGWRLLERLTEVDAWLSQAYSPTAAGAFGPTRLQPGERQRLVWLVDANNLPWQQACWSLLSALPARGWQLHILLQQESMAWLLNPPELRSLVQIGVLPADLESAAKMLRALNPHVLLFGNAAGDSLQFWLSHQRLAHLQFDWTAHTEHFKLVQQACLDAQAPLQVMDFTPSESGPGQDLLFAVPDAGWLPADLDWLKSLDLTRLQLIATPNGLGALQQLLKALEADPAAQTAAIKVSLWRSAQELAALYAGAACLLMPIKGGELYQQAAAAIGLPQLASGAVLPQTFEPSEQAQAAWRAWRNQLPATSWAVQVQDLTSHALRGEL